MQTTAEHAQNTAAVPTRKIGEKHKREGDNFLVEAWVDENASAGFKIPEPQTSFASSVPVSVSRFFLEEATRERGRTGLGFHEDMHLHVPPPGEFEPERPERVFIMLEHLKSIGLLDCCYHFPFTEATSEDLRLVHTQSHIDWVDSIPFYVSISTPLTLHLDPSLYLSKGSLRAARLAAGCVAEAAQLVASGQLVNAIAFVRPPGHHATENYAKGFCLLNNVAIGARVAQKKCGDNIRNVMIIDWDVHHGNGTESIFYNDPSVLVFSLQEHFHGPTHALSRDVARFLTRPFKLRPAVDDKPAVRIARDDELMELLNDDVDDHSEGVEEVGSQPKEGSDASPQDDPPRPTLDDPSGGKSKKLPSQLLQVTDDDAMELFRQAGYDLNSRTSEEQDESQQLEDTSAEEEMDEEVDVESSNAPQMPAFYPCTGDPLRIGTGAGRGYNVNVSWPTVGFGDIEYLYVLEQLAVPMAKEFRPDIVFISCGFDAVDGDTLGSMRLSPSGYYTMTKLIQNKICAKVVVVLEGGYNLRKMPLCAEAVVRALVEGSQKDCAGKSMMLIHQCQRFVNEIKERLSPHWKCFQCSPGARSPKKETTSA